MSTGEIEVVPDQSGMTGYPVMVDRAHPEVPLVRALLGPCDGVNPNE
jgi:hypothetical protein